MQKKSRLTEQSYWNSIHKRDKLPGIVDINNVVIKSIIESIDPYIIGHNFKSILEVGCGSSAWLPLFSTRYNLEISGLDYSEAGCIIARRNLEFLNIPFIEIYNEDLFEFKTDQKWDIIISFGVIEHFEDPSEVFSILSRYLNWNGVLITIVPNLEGLMGFILRHFMPRIYGMHKVITIDHLNKYSMESGLVNYETSYLGAINLGAIPWSKLIELNKGKLPLMFIKFFIKFIYFFGQILLQVTSKFLVPSPKYSSLIISIDLRK